MSRPSSAPLKATILAEIRRIAQEHGQPPGARSFANQSGIPQSSWYGVLWPKWSDALVEAGFEPNSRQGRFESREVLRAVAEASLKRGSVLTAPEMKILRLSDPSFPNPKTVAAHFRNRAGLLEALRSFCVEEKSFSALISVLPEAPEAQPDASKASEGWVYLLRSGSFYKVGRSDEIERRIKEITTALPDAAELVHAIRTDDPPGIEAYWHRRFNSQRANGEWFKLDRAHIAAFRRRKFQ